MRYQSFIIKKFLNSLIINGKKETATKILYQVLKELKYKTKKNPYDIIEQAVEEAKPIIGLKRARKSSKIIYLPKLLTLEHEYRLGVKWLITGSKNIKERHIVNKLTKEILLVSNKKGATLNKKKILYKTVLANRPYLSLLRKK